MRSLSEAMQEFEQNVAGIVEDFGESPSGRSLYEAMGALRSQLNELGRACMTTLVGEAEQHAPALVRGDTSYRYKQTTVKTWYTPWGPVEVGRRLYQADRGGRSLIPVDDRCGMRERFMFPMVERTVAYLGAHLTAGEVGEALRETLGHGPSNTAIGHVLSAVGREADATSPEIGEALRADELQADEADVLIASLDGTCVPLRETSAKRGRPRSRPGRETPRTQKTAWRECGVGMVASYASAFGDDPPEKLDARYLAWMPEKRMATLRAELSALVRTEMDRRTYPLPVFIADGKAENWEYAASCPVLKDAMQILDFYHAAEHLTLAAEALHGKDNAKARRWCERWREKLKHAPNGAVNLIRAIDRDRRRLRPGSKRARTARRERNYFKKNLGRMRYAAFRRQGLPIGSGPIEAACKTIVGQRLKRSGMRWTRPGGQHILNLRTAAKSNRWNTLWNAIMHHREIQNAA